MESPLPLSLQLSHAEQPVCVPGAQPRQLQPGGKKGLSAGSLVQGPASSLCSSYKGGSWAPVLAGSSLLSGAVGTLHFFGVLVS